MLLQRGEKRRLGDLGVTTTFTVQFDAGLRGADVSVFGLDDDRQLRDDQYFVFYNQPRSPHGALTTTAQPSSAGGTFEVNLGALPASITRLMFVATHDDTPFSAAAQGTWTLTHAGGTAAQYTYAGSDFGAERAVMVAEVYRHNGEWRVAAVGQGFGGGLQALLEHFGGQAEEAAPAPAPAPDTLPEPSAEKVSLRKQQVTAVLQRAGIEHVKARVMVVMDASGSMRALYRNGVVQDTLERLIPVALKLDDNEAMEFWYYAERFAQMGDLDQHSVVGLVGDVMPQKNPLLPAHVHSIGGGNNEPPVMEDVLRQHREAQAEDRAAGVGIMPTLVLFLTDGGISGSSKKIAQLIKGSSSEPLFWQFIGLGDANYGILRQLDTLQGRVIDNSGFFAVDDIAQVTDEVLYDRMLSEFAGWWKAWQQLQPPAAPTPRPAPTAAVSLRKNGAVQLQKAATLRAALEWKGQGDLDLYAFYVLADGTSGKVYYRDLGHKDRAPYITLSGDSRVPGREEIVIHRPDALRHVLISAYSAVENGLGSFASYQPRAVVTDGGAQRVDVPVLNRNHFSFWVALASIDFTSPSGPTIRHVERYSRIGTERSPTLNADGTFTMNTGPVEFKGR
ncbi:VWA domain-containing protein [Deinococcus maricopensis]|uniref:Stress protein n=1 Tax=Deinococcus maricopensis (strain DSM 21211 / LMG 22137 / NRRL B-23946 / LB-34) TaxID=709986 RepID=E8U596_DEIML|nr:VWA domain-containing protein [Deinococcus maricopensis]ADV66235.1 stress protein [Deinococcus maricopensis DSM 21211]